MNSIDHPDNRGVFVELWTIDLLDGDHAAALLLSQLLWWHQPGKDGRPKVSYERNGSTWVLRPDDGWQDCRLTQKQVRRIRSVLVGKGLIEHKRFKLNGAPTSAWRPLFESIQEAIRPNPELPLEGQFQGSDPQGVVGSDPRGAVPIPSPPSRDTRENHVGAGKRRRIPDPFIVTAKMQEWAIEKYPAVNWREQTEQFRDHHRGNGTTKLDWEATWRTWIRNAGTRFAPRSGNAPEGSPRLSKSRQNSDRVFERMMASERDRSQGDDRLGGGELATGDHRGSNGSLVRLPLGP